VFGQDKDGGMPHLAQRLNQRKRLLGGNVRKQQMFAFKNQSRMRLDVRSGVPGSAHNSHLAGAGALHRASDLRRIIFFLWEEGQNGAARFC